MTFKLFRTLFFAGTIVGMSACANIDEEEQPTEELVTVSQQLKRGMVICKPGSVRPHTKLSDANGESEDDQPEEPVDEEVYEEECTEPGEETAESASVNGLARRKKVHRRIRKDIYKKK